MNKSVSTESSDPGGPRMVDRLISHLVHLMERYYPDLFLFIILITLTTFLLAFITTGYHPKDMLVSWGSSLPDILSFTMQMTLMVMISHALAHTAVLQKLLHRLSALPRTQAQAYQLTVLITGIIAMISWPLGLIAGGIIAKKIGESARDRGIKIHYPLLVAAAMCGNVVWHMGYSASAPLFVATENNNMMGLIGGTIPMTETVFTTWNLSLAVALLIGMILLSAYIRPRDADVIELRKLPEESAPAPSLTDVNRPVAALEESRLFTALIGGALFVFLALWFSQQGFNLNLNIVNWTFLGLLLLLCKSVKHFMVLIGNSTRIVGPLIIAYPFYAGIIGVMVDSGMASMLSNWFAEIATTKTLPIWAFTSAMVVNMFIPSGGAQWVIQGPIFLEAANTLGVKHSLIVMSIAYGDQLTNLIQPLPAIPLLLLAGLRIKHIMGYMLVFCLAGFVILGTGLTIISIF